MDIFKTENEIINGNWMSFKKVGDRIQGTLVGSRLVFNTLRNDDQKVYEVLINKDSICTVEGKPAEFQAGDVVNVGGKPAIDAQMARVTDGQIVGFLFQETKKSTRPGYSDTKIIKVFAQPGIVDEAWLAGHPAGSRAAEPAAPTKTGDRAGAAARFDKELETGDSDDSGIDVAALKKEISSLAKKKLKATDELDVYQKVSEATGLPMNEANLEAVRDRLLAL